MKPLHAICTAILIALGTAAVQAHHSRGGIEREAGAFDYYLLSLSWAPTYCLTHRGEECSGKGYGFVLHGLWPQFEDGGYPERCSSGHGLSDEAAIKGRTLYPSEQLMRHEWQEHGTCTGFDALAYFHIADRATAAVKVPPALDSPGADRSLTTAQVIALFREANRSMPDGAMTVACSRGQLSEVRVCLTKDLGLRQCGRGVHTVCPQTPLYVPASR